MPEHPRAIQARQLFHALWDDGDMEATIEAMSADVVWVNDIGAGPLRELRGRDQVRALLLWWFDFFDGNCRHELIDVCASDDRVIEVLHEIGEKDGRVFDNVATLCVRGRPTGSGSLRPGANLRSRPGQRRGVLVAVPRRADRRRRRVARPISPEGGNHISDHDGRGAFGWSVGLPGARYPSHPGAQDTVRGTSSRARGVARAA
jgi:ketosteroid isomerase-like protein